MENRKQPFHNLAGREGGLCSGSLLGPLAGPLTSAELTRVDGSLINDLSFPAKETRRRGVQFTGHVGDQRGPHDLRLLMHRPSTI